MKHTLTVLAACVTLGTAGAAWYDDSTFAPYGEEGDGLLLYDESPGVDPLYTTPNANTSDGGRKRAFIPDNAYFEYFGNMTLSGQHARLQVFNAYLSLPLTTPERAGLWGWHLDATASVRVTWLDSTGERVLDENRLYSLGLQASISHKLGRNSQIQLGGIGLYSSDFDVASADNFYMGCYAAFSSRFGENLRYTIGIAYMPDFYEHYVYPMINVAWRYNPVWELNIQASRLSILHVGNERFHWGPFLQWNASRWTVRRDRRTEQFRMTSFIGGIGATYDITTASSARVMLLGDLGCSFYNTFRVRDKKGNHTLEKYRAHPGLYLRLGAQILF